MIFCARQEFRCSSARPRIELADEIAEYGGAVAGHSYLFRCNKVVPATTNPKKVAAIVESEREGATESVFIASEAFKDIERS